MKTYINVQNPKTILEVIHHANGCCNDFQSKQGFHEAQDNGEKIFGKDHANKDTKVLGNKDQHNIGNKKKEGNEYKSQNKLSPTNLEKYQKEY